MRVLLADDQTEVRSALRLLLEQEAQVNIVGEAVDVSELLQQVWGVRPDAVLLDWELTRNGIAPRTLISALRTLRPNLKVIALSGRVEARQQALGAGADVFISKGAPPEHLLAALAAHPTAG
ncbi:MAG TPA: response regulator transcription factor [Anaerolineaceae bacterium]|nr:response regulator transcription factor [Anaerolineaceae bacterium]